MTGWAGPRGSVDRRVLFLLLVSAVVVAGVFILMKPVPQWPSYHDFADTRALGGVPNALNILSSGALLLAGAWGLMLAIGRVRAGPVDVCYLALFGGVFIAGLGSMYYHWAPTNGSLVWDRLPITVACMGLLAAAIGELISPGWARNLLLPLLAVGAASVAWWITSEQAGAGDLRPYGIVQVLPALLILLMLLLYPRPAGFASALAVVAAFYLLAKVFELYDGQVYGWLGFVSGHTLKHLFAAAGMVGLLRWYSHRPLAGPPAAPGGLTAHRHR